VAGTEPTYITATTSAPPGNPVVSQAMAAVDSKASATQTVTGKGVTRKTVAREAAAAPAVEALAASATSTERGRIDRDAQSAERKARCDNSGCSLPHVLTPIKPALCGVA
jgi:hypothetical protein